MKTGAHVAILLATYNGARYLHAQLDSIAAQDHGDWSLHVSDDGSQDRTHEIVAEFARAHPDRKIVWRMGPGRGSTVNFLSLLRDTGIKADHFAFADQDDVWLPGKLRRAVEALARHPDDAALYGSRSWIADADLTIRGMSPLPRRAPAFRNALVQSFAGGNTMVLNAKARALARRAGPADGAVCHDWWLYQLVSGAGGQVLYDPVPSLLYRQHEANQIGANLSLPARLRRLSFLLRGKFAAWNGANTAELKRAASILTPESRDCLEAFLRLRGDRGLRALRQLRAAGLFRQSRAGDLSLALATMLGRV
ncbi:glycosyltransferase family 2 protein [Albidovulum sediminicola]|uniref:Glycosyltransferase family 2 protein n=1 Tax=Albidovulum sediminicola TaxID=2984331 RepID=A0ABT2Z2D3_9RHOB|nr:glycosyltransferase family 2 protein [Defluviimonas sp. WL0075]MCV2865288.1 glycosyltransferase family 2 protein [Defluviimonas sp. WL0075]